MRWLTPLKQLSGATLIVACATPPAATPDRLPSADATRCDAGPRECSAFRGTGFAEAYVRFIYASPNELAAALPLSVSTDQTVPKEVPSLTDGRWERAESLRQTLAGLSCFSVTEQELDALIDALGIPRPPGRTVPIEPARFAEIIEAFGLPVTEAQLRDLKPLPRSHLVSVRHVPEACATVYRIPNAALERLAAESDSDALGQRWLGSIRASGPNPATFEGGESRDDSREWEALAGDLIDLARLRTCGRPQLYVEVAYDC